MPHLMKILRIKVLPDDPATHELLTWFNYVVVPIVFMFAGLHRAWSTATTPFEEYVGVTVAVGFALLWPVFVSALPKRKDVA